MSGKSKKTTADKTVYNQKQTKYISHSASKMVNRLSLSFYGENTLKMQKQIILDTYDQFSSQHSPLSREASKPTSYSKAKLIKPKTQVVRFLKQHYHNPLPEKIMKPIKQIQNEKDKEKKQIKNLSRPRSSSKSSRGKSKNSVLFNYIANRIDGSAKGWNGLKPTQQNRNSYIKKI